MRAPSAIFAVTLGLLLAGCGTLTKTPHLIPPAPVPAITVAPKLAAITPPPIPPTPLPVKRGCVPRGLEDVSKYPALTRALLEKGYSAEGIRKIYGGNLIRVMKAVEGIAAAASR